MIEPGTRRRSPIRQTRLGRAMMTRVDYAFYQVAFAAFWEAMSITYDENGKPFSDQRIINTFRESFDIDPDDLPDSTALSNIAKYKKERKIRR